MATTYAAWIFTICTAIVIIFQACLAAGLPWGAASMGGKYPGKYPRNMRFVAVFNMFLLAMINAIVLTKAGIICPSGYSIARIAIWVVVVFYVPVTILNTITPSKIERIWAPVALTQLVASLLVALH